MFAPQSSGGPITVVVDTEANTWLAYSPEPITPWAAFLYGELQKMGGVSDTVPTGTYHFQIQFIGMGQMEASLTPFDDSKD